MMQKLDQDDEIVRIKGTEKSDSSPTCAQLGDAYQKEDLKSNVKKAFESRNSHTHGTAVLVPFLFTQN